MEPYLASVLWIVIVGFLIAFLLSFAVGANDVANSFATSYGAGVLTFKQICVLATIFEISGAVLLGYKVSDTIRRGILDVNNYIGNEQQLMYGMLAALIGCTIWLLVATYFGLPVSTTHSIVGATVGFGLVAHGTEGLKWRTLITIASSWVISPLMSGVLSVILLFAINRFILTAKNPFSAGLTSLPFVYALTIFVNILSITWDGPALLKLDDLPLWLVFTISGVAAVIVGILTQIALKPYYRKKILAEPITHNEKPSAIESGIKPVTSSSSTEAIINPVESEEHVNKLFHFLQIVAACFASFAHGGNDVSNAVGPLIAIWMIYTEGSVEQKSTTPWWLLFYGGIGIVFGLWLLGKRVITTVGQNLTTKITPATGFVIEIGAAATVLLASKLGLPISTTHCKVGSVVFVGWSYGRGKYEKAVDWSLFGNIVMAWIVTLPAAGLSSALMMWIFSNFY